MTVYVSLKTWTWHGNMHKTYRLDVDHKSGLSYESLELLGKLGGNVSKAWINGQDMSIPTTNWDDGGDFVPETEEAYEAYLNVCVTAIMEALKNDYDVWMGHTSEELESMYDSEELERLRISCMVYEELDLYLDTH